MLNYILFIIGFILIGFSIIVIRKDLKKTETKIEEITKIEDNIREYYKLTEEMIDSFDNVIGSKIEEISAESIYFSKKAEKESIEETISSTKDYNNNTNSKDNIIEKIFELQSIGLDIEEIAKKLNKGVREIEIIIKMYNTKK